MDGKEVIRVMEKVLNGKGWDNHESSFEETIRREMLKYKKENELLREDIKHLTKAYYNLLESKCKGVCILDEERKYCVGCGRTIEEIIAKGNEVKNGNTKK